ncbi:MAG: zinc-regulated TonB-dependent outer membrane receptor [candidate division NC10 bacterium]|nr:zinc-regulated TonB-dependent outer membrane receptor [candidate division NC10 bacterium]
MHTRMFACAVLFVLVSGGWSQTAFAAPTGTEIEDLKKQMALMEEQLRFLRQKVERLEAKPAVAAPEAPVEKQNGKTEQRLKDLELQVGQQRAASRGLLAPFNPKISVKGLFSAAMFSERDTLNFGDHDPQVRGFNVQNVELHFQGTVDPYFQVDTNIVTTIKKGDTTIELEEMYGTSLALPANLQLVAGQYFTRFGRQNRQHPHQWDFADQPVILNRIFGPDGLRGPGAQLSWLAPTPFYLEFIGSAQQAEGEIATSFLSKPGKTVRGYTLIDRPVRKVGDLLYMPRVVTSFSLTDELTVAIGGSSLFGPNASGTNTRTSVYGGDLYVKWKPVDHVQGFPFVAWQTEYLHRNYNAGPDDVNGIPASRLKDFGFYTQVLYGFTYRWVAGLRVDYANGSGGGDAVPFLATLAQRDLVDERWRFSPNMTFYPSEFSKFRLQYNLDFADSRGREAVHGVFLQLELNIGEHGAHSF